MKGLSGPRSLDLQQDETEGKLKDITMETGTLDKK